jgi:hypothetical protein
VHWRRALGAGAITVLGASSSAGLEGPGWQARQSSLDGLPRTVTVSFGEIEAIWSAGDCRLTGVWRGSQLLASAAPQQPLWLLRSETSETEPKAELKGYRRSGDDLVLDCKLHLSNGGEVWIEELPSLIHSDDGTPGLRRTFRSYGVPAGQQVWTDISIAPMPSPRDLSSNGDLRTRNRQRIRRMLRRSSTTEAELGLVSNGATRLDAYFASDLEPLAAGATGLDALEVSQSDELGSQIDDSTSEPVDDGDEVWFRSIKLREL